MDGPRLRGRGRRVVAGARHDAGWLARADDASRHARPQCRRIATADPRRSSLASIATSLPANGDPFGVRADLARRGIRYNGIYTGEVFGNVAGGKRRGALYEAKFEFNTTWDLEKLAGIQGLTFFGNAFQIHRTAGISRNYVGAIQTISAIEALPTSRLSELWIEQKVLDGTLGLRVGQLAADSEFFISTYSLPFINSDFPAISKADLPGGGPAYPLSTPGVRLRWDPNNDFSLLGAVFNGDPAGPGSQPEIQNRNGINFRVQDPALIWTEAQFRYNQIPDTTALAGALRLGAWTHLGRFDDQRFDGSGQSLASPTSNGVARRLRNNNNVYAVLDQQLWRPEGGDATSGITAFSRIGAAPGDRNLIDFYLDGGVIATGLVPGRPRDLFGVTALYSHLSRFGRTLDRDAAAFGLSRGLRSSEVAIEATYVAEIVPGWSVQPDIQYIIRPGGNVPSPGSLAGPVGNAVVLGLRTTIVY